MNPSKETGALMLDTDRLPLRLVVVHGGVRHVEHMLRRARPAFDVTGLNGLCGATPIDRECAVTLTIAPSLDTAAALLGEGTYTGPMPPRRGPPRPVVPPAVRAIGRGR